MGTDRDGGLDMWAVAAMRLVRITSMAVAALVMGLLALQGILAKGPFPFLFM